MIKDEFKFIRHNKLIMLSVMVIMFIPFLYAIFFLKSVWDPYGDTQALPVAVVNNDKPVTYNGTRLDVGAQTVDKLHDNKQLGWRFVSAAKAKDGLKHNKYYTVVTIPENFSKNAATVLDAHPKKMQLKYETNDSLNYLSQVISGIGVDKLDKEIRANVTNAYASTLFAQIKTMGKGFSKAAKGATQLSDGMVTLDDGVSQYTVGVSTVNKGLQTLKVSVKPLTSGVQQLADGGNQLQAGVGPLTAGVQKLANGGNQLQAGVGPLSTGAAQLVAGANQLKAGTGELRTQTADLPSQSKQLNNGAQTLHAGTSVLKTKTTNMPAQVKELNQGAHDLVTTGTSQLQQKTQTMPAQVKQLNQGAHDVDSGVGAYVAGVNEAMQTLQTKTKAVPAGADKLAAGVAQLKAGVAANTASGATTSAAIKADMMTLSKTLIANKDFASLKVVADLNKQLSALQQTQTTSTENLNAGLDQLSAGLGNLADGGNALVAGFDTAATKMQPGVKQLTDGTKALASGTQTLADNTPDLVNGIAALNTGATKIAAGTQQLADNTPALVGGINQLNDGTTELAAGTKLLAGKTPALTAGIAQLDTGASQLDGGLNQLNSKVPALSAGVSQLAGGLNQLNAQTPALASGVNQLASGLNQLNSKTPALASGVNQLADGGEQLTAKSGELTDGAGKLKDGNQTLATQLGAGAKEVNGVKLTTATEKMFSAPTKTTQKHYSYVANYGHALAPYVLSLALYVGALVFNFAYPIRKVSHADGTPTQWFWSKVVLGGLVAVGMAVIEASLIMLGGLQVDHVGLFYAMAIAFSLTSMYFVMMLSMAFDNPGRFVAMVMLMLQLGGAGGTFPLEITNGFYNAIHPFLPMSYSVLGFRQAITSGIYTGTVANSFAYLFGFAVVCLGLLWVAMQVLQRHHLMGVSQLDDNQKLQAIEK